MIPENITYSQMIKATSVYQNTPERKKDLTPLQKRVLRAKEQEAKMAQKKEAMDKLFKYRR